MSSQQLLERRIFIKKADIITVAAVIVLAVVLILLKNSQDAVTAEISVSGETLFEIDLTTVKEPYDLELENSVIIHIEQGSAAFLKSGCAGQDCVKCGTLTKAGDAAVCIPNETMIRIKGTSADLPDAIVY